RDKLVTGVQTCALPIWKKLNGPANCNVPVQFPITLPNRLASVFHRDNVLGETIAWAAPCISGRGRRIPANLFGVLVATREEPRKIGRASCRERENKE